MAKKLSNALSEEEVIARDKKIKIKKIIYMAVWALVLLLYFIAGMTNIGFEESKTDVIFAVMMFIVPVATLLLDFLHFLRFEKYNSTSSFAILNCILVLLVSYIGEAMAVIIGFGLDTPQYKLLYTFALGFALFTAVVSLFIAGFFGMATGARKRR